MNFTEEIIIRKAEKPDIECIWQIILDAKEQMRQAGSVQWQDGYPKQTSIESDIENGYGYVLTINDNVIAYAALIFDIEPAYEIIEGKWLTQQPYAVIHRMAVAKNMKGKGIANYFFQQLEKIVVENSIYSLRVDTNFDNRPMLSIINKRNYTYCGEVYFRGSARKAFEKVLA